MKKAIILIICAVMMFCSCAKTQEKSTSSGYPSVYYSLEPQTTFFGTFRSIKSIFEKNARMLGMIKYVDEDILREYIVPNGTEDECSAVLADIKALSDDICKDCTTDSERLYAIAEWVSENIYYDRDAADTSVTNETVSLKNVFENRRTTCAGYSNAVSALCGAQGIICVNLRGGSSSTGYTRARLEEAPKNHEWNGVVIDGEWVFCDSTWASQNRFENGAFFKNDILTDYYFSFPFGEMSIEHRIDIADLRDFYGISNRNSQKNPE